MAKKKNPQKTAPKSSSKTVRQAKAAPPARMVDLNNLSSSDLDEVMRKVHEARVEKLLEEQAPMRQKFHALMAEITAAVEPYGLTGQKFLTMNRPQLQRHLLQTLENQESASTRGAPQRRIVKVAIKYRDPKDSSRTWTGRGNQPLWVRDHLAAGGTLDEVTVKH